MFAVTLAGGAAPAASVQFATIPSLVAPSAIAPGSPAETMPLAISLDRTAKPASLSLLLAGAATTAPAMPALPDPTASPGPVPSVSPPASPLQQGKSADMNFPAPADAIGSKTEGEDLPLANVALAVMPVDPDSPRPKAEDIAVDIGGGASPTPAPGTIPDSAASAAPAAAETGPDPRAANAPRPPLDEAPSAPGELMPVRETQTDAAAPQQAPLLAAATPAPPHAPLQATAAGLAAPTPPLERGPAIAKGGNGKPEAIVAGPAIPGAPSRQPLAGKLDSAKAAPAVLGNVATPPNEGRQDGGVTAPTSEKFEPVADVSPSDGAEPAVKTDKGQAQLQPPEAAMRAAPSAAADRPVSPAALQPAAPVSAALSPAAASSSPVVDISPQSAPDESQPVLEARAGQLGREMGVEIARRISAGVEELVIRLDPAELGRISIRMSLTDQGSLRAVLAADAPAALEVLRHEIGDLGRALEQAGVRTDADSLRFDRGQGGENGSAWQRYQGQGRTARPGGAAAESMDQPEQVNVRTSGRVDLMA